MKGLVSLILLLNLSAGLFAHSVYKIGSAEDYYSCGMRRIVDDSTHHVGFENKKGRVVLPMIYCQAERFVKKKCLVLMNAVLLDSSATDEAGESVWQGGQWGVIDKKGSFVKPCLYQRSWNDELGCYVYQSETESFKVTSKGKIVIIK